MTKHINFYNQAFKKLRRANNNGGAPHKPILLIAVLQAYRTGLIIDNKIRITPELVGLFKDNWSVLVETKHNCRFFLPFFHMSNEKADFWRLIPNLGFEKFIATKDAIRSFKGLLNAVNFAEIDIELHQLLSDEVANRVLESELLDKYFPNHQEKDDAHSFLSNLSKDILEDTPIEYANKLKRIRNNTAKDEFEEEVYVRSSRFKQEVINNYNHTCAISELKIYITSNVSILDACHIIPFSESYNDTITNGISLTPTLHRAFDRGLIAISDDYRVLVKDNFSESNDSPYSIQQFSGKRILLPNIERRHPSKEGFEYHRKRFNFA